MGFSEDYMRWLAGHIIIYIEMSIGSERWMDFFELPNGVLLRDSWKKVNQTKYEPARDEEGWGSVILKTHEIRELRIGHAKDSWDEEGWGSAILKTHEMKRVEGLDMRADAQNFARIEINWPRHTTNEPQTWLPEGSSYTDGMQLV